jgi:hypothetical protein
MQAFRALDGAEQKITNGSWTATYQKPDQTFVFGVSDVQPPSSTTSTTQLFRLSTRGASQYPLTHEVPEGYILDDVKANVAMTYGLLKYSSETNPVPYYCIRELVTQSAPCIDVINTFLTDSFLAEREQDIVLMWQPFKEQEVIAWEEGNQDMVLVIDVWDETTTPIEGLIYRASIDSGKNVGRPSHLALPSSPSETYTLEQHKQIFTVTEKDTLTSSKFRWDIDGAPVWLGESILVGLRGSDLMIADIKQKKQALVAPVAVGDIVTFHQPMRETSPEFFVPVSALRAQ